MTLMLQVCTGHLLYESNGHRMLTCCISHQSLAVTIQNALTHGCAGTPANQLAHVAMETQQKNDVTARGL